MGFSEYYTTADGTQVPTPRRARPHDVLTVGAYLGMKVFDAVTDTCNLAYAFALSHRDAIDEATAFLREGLEEIQTLTSSKFLADPASFGVLIQDGIEEAFEEGLD